MNKRRTFLINKKVQLKYVLFTLAPLFLGGAFLYYLIYFLVMRQMAIPENIVYNLLPAMEQVNRILLFVGPVLFIALFCAVVWLTHKLTGPLYRLEKELEKFAAGDDSVRISFRKGDDLEELATSVNKVLEKANKAV